MTTHETLDICLAAADLRAIDLICDRFEADRRAGRPTDLASYLSDAPAAARATLFRELLNLELDLQQKDPVRPDARIYHQRFPDLADEIDAVFESWNNRVLTARPLTCDGQNGQSTVASPEPLNTGAETAPGADLGFVTGREADLPGYEILGELGRGGMGIVLKARQIALNRAVAVKLIKTGVFATEAELLRFQNEAEAVAQLDHPHIVPIYEVGKYHGTHFFSMKLIEGSSLDKRLAEFAARSSRGGPYRRRDRRRHSPCSPARNSPSRLEAGEYPAR